MERETMTAMAAMAAMATRGTVNKENAQIPSTERQIAHARE